MYRSSRKFAYPDWRGTRSIISNHPVKNRRRLLLRVAIGCDQSGIGSFNPIAFCVVLIATEYGVPDCIGLRIKCAVLFYFAVVAQNIHVLLIEGPVSAIDQFFYFVSLVIE